MGKTLLSYDEALAAVLSRAARLGEESVGLPESRGRVLASDVMTDRDQPPFDRSAMDGFAVVADSVEAGTWYPIVGEVAAGAVEDGILSAGQVMRIATGAALPRGADATIPIEKAEVDGEWDGGQNGGQSGGQNSGRVRFPAGGCAAWSCIHKRASDARAGHVVLAKGTVMGPAQVGIAATVGAVRLTVIARPRVAVLTTGDEVLDPATTTGDMQVQQIRNSNGPMLCALLGAMGIEADAVRHVHVADDLEATIEAARHAVETSDVVLTTGGVSVGARDYLPRAWDALGVEKILHGVAIQPGKPVYVGVREAADGRCLVLGLPGNPVSVLATAHLFAYPALCRMMGMPMPSWQRVRLSESVKAKSAREVFRAAVLCDARNASVDDEDDHVGATARVIPWQGSGDLMHTATATGWVRLPCEDKEISAGEVVRYQAMLR